MEIRNNITEWASPATKVIELTNGFGSTTYKLRVREFVPIEHDSLVEVWADGGVLKKHPIPPFALENMEEATDEIRNYVDKSVAPSLVALAGNADPLVWDTYVMAFKYSSESPVSQCLSKNQDWQLAD